MLCAHTQDTNSPWCDVEPLLAQDDLDVVLADLRGGELAGEGVAAAVGADGVVHGASARVGDAHEDLVLPGAVVRAVEGDAAVHREQVEALVRLGEK